MLFYLSRQCMKAGVLRFYQSTFPRSNFNRQQRSRRTFDSIISEYDYKTYFEQKLSTVDADAGSIIKEMASPQCDRRKLRSMISNYLDYHKRCRQPAGLIMILTGLHNAEFRDFKDEFSVHICEFIIRSNDMKDFVCDQRSLPILLGVMVKKYHSKFDKIKKSVLKYKFAQILKLSIDNVQQHQLQIILDHMMTLVDQSLVSEPLRFVSVALLLEEKSTKFIQDIIMKIQPNVRITKYSKFLRKLLEFYRIFPPTQEKSVEMLYYALVHVVFTPKDAYKTNFIFNFYVYFPYVGKNSKGTYFRDLILAQIRTSTPSTREDNIFVSWHYAVLLYNVLSFEFYKFMNQVQFRYEGDVNYLLKQDLKVPQLDPYFWELYKKCPGDVNKSSPIFYDVLRSIYPQQYIESNSTPQVIKPNAASENEVKMRVTMALEELGLKNQTQIFLCGRYVDFVLQEGIILQIDGDYHFNMHKMDYNQTSQFRNLHLLLSGYRVILVNIFEYNEHRFTDQLSALIDKKLQFMRQTGAVLVI